MFCTKCGSKLSEAAAFCHSCGAPVGKHVALPQTQADRTAEAARKNTPVKAARNNTPVKAVSLSPEEKTAQKKKSRKHLRIAIIIVVILAAGGFAAVKFGQYYESLPDQYHAAYTEALQNGEYEKAQELYAKYLTFYDPEKRFLSGIYSISGTKEEVLAYTTQAFAEKCERMKLAEEAFAYISAGDFDKGNAIFTNNDISASLRDVPHNRLKIMLPQMLEAIDPIQVQAVNFGFDGALYWLNADGTVGMVSGDPIVTNWTNIAKLKVSGSMVAGLRHDGTLIYKMNRKEQQMTDGIADFDLNEDAIAAVKIDGTVWTDGDYHSLSGIPYVERWTDIAAVKVERGDLYSQSPDYGPDGHYQRPQKKTNTQYSCPYVVAQTRDGRLLCSGYNQKIILRHEAEQATAQDIIDSLEGGSGWDDVLGALTDPSWGTNNHPDYWYEAVPVSVEGASFDADEPAESYLNTDTGAFRIIQGADGKWTAADTQ